jgi:hypothetical protein
LSEQPDFDLRVRNLQHRREMAELQSQRHSHEAKYPTQRPNGVTPMSSPWFTDEFGVQCRLLSADPLTIAEYSAMMARRAEGSS